MQILDIILKLNNGQSVEEIEKELHDIDLKKSKEKGKCFGECEVCGQETVLVEEVGLCGPCCFGESETANGNW